MSPPALFFSSRFTNNCLLIVDCLEDEDLQTGRRLFEDVQAMTNPDQPNYCHYFRPETIADLTSWLQDLKAQCLSGMRPILHIEAHGDEADGIQVRSSGQSIRWESLLPLLQEINKATKNNLGVVMAACFGLYAIRPLEIDEPCPFYFLVGPDSPVPAGYIDESMRRFYARLLEARSLDFAMNEVEERFRQFHCEKFFYVMFAKYLKRFCAGSGGERRIEDLITLALEKSSIRNRAKLRALRKSAKSFVKSHGAQEATFNRRAGIFLHGRKSVSFSELQAFIRADA